MMCVRCNRPLTTPAATVGIYAYGPKCAKAAGMALIRAATQRHKPAQQHADERQADWIAEATA